MGSIKPRMVLINILIFTWRRDDIGKCIDRIENELSEALKRL
jgi:hypothetical protein